MTVVTRFAPSPTGFLHIGSARTALFNWLYARHHGGKFLLRVEDTDLKRSTQEAIDAIFDGMKWLGLDWDDQEIFQTKSVERHKEIANELLKQGKAYKCYCSKEELAQMREKATKEGRHFKYDGSWRNRDESEAPAGMAPVIRLKAPQEGETIINDLVQGEIVVPNQDLDDMILLRDDGTPTYMLAVVVDDHDMGITHIIRGDDHLTNASRQALIYQAMGWDVPKFAHIPLIHGSDGAKLSKRHGALGVDAYRDMGFLPEAIRNYLLRLGWSHGDEEIISTDQAIGWFDLDKVGKSPARFDIDKLNNLNGHYIRESDDEFLLNMISPMIGDYDEICRERLLKGMTSLKTRAKSINELAESAKFYIIIPEELTAKAKKALEGEGKAVIGAVIGMLNDLDNWLREDLESSIRDFSEKSNMGLGKIMMPIRAAITGSHVSPSMFEVMEILGKEETIKRLKQS